jgi:hypothetical protein
MDRLTITHPDQVFLLQEAIEQFLSRTPPRMLRIHELGQDLLDQLTKSDESDTPTPAT